jgi:hypothetical protein
MIILATPNTTMKGLNERQQNICIYGGLFGALLATTCLIQHMVISGTHWIAFILMGIYIYTLLAFLLLAFQKAIAPILLIGAASLMLITVLFVRLAGLISPALVLLYLYCTIMTVLVYIEYLPQRLKEKEMLKRNEEIVWKDKI